MKSVVLMTQGRYRLISYGNGLAYDLQDMRARLSTFVQGDDAAEFLIALHSIEEIPEPRRSSLSYMWDEMGYGDIAEAMDCE